MRAYNVNIVAELDGKSVEFVEVIAFPLKSCPVEEHNREAGAVEQVRIKYPQLKNIRSNGSIHVDYKEDAQGRPLKYIPFPTEFGARHSIEKSRPRLSDQLLTTTPAADAPSTKGWTVIMNVEGRMISSEPLEKWAADALRASLERKTVSFQRFG